MTITLDQLQKHLETDGWIRERLTLITDQYYQHLIKGEKPFYFKDWRITRAGAIRVNTSRPTDNIMIAERFYDSFDIPVTLLDNDSEVDEFIAARKRAVDKANADIAATIAFAEKQETERRERELYRTLKGKYEVISVEDALPPKGHVILIKLENSDEVWLQGMYLGEERGWESLDGFPCKNVIVTHWAFLPASPNPVIPT